MDHLGVDKAHLIGETIGGTIALEFAYRSPSACIPRPLRSAAPELGEGNEEILTSIGYTKEQIADLEARTSPVRYRPRRLTLRLDSMLPPVAMIISTAE